MKLNCFIGIKQISRSTNQNEMKSDPRDYLKQEKFKEIYFGVCISGNQIIKLKNKVFLMVRYLLNFKVRG